MTVFMSHCMSLLMALSDIGRLVRRAFGHTQKMPLRIRRSFTRAAPRGLFGSIDLMAAHSWSVSS